MVCYFTVKKNVMQQAKHFYTLCFRETVQYSSEFVAKGKLSTHCPHLLSETHPWDGCCDQQTRQQQWRDPVALPGWVETCKTTVEDVSMVLAYHKTNNLQFYLFLWNDLFVYFQSQCDLHSLIQVMMTVFSEVPPLRMCLNPEDCEYSFLVYSHHLINFSQPYRAV